MSSNLEAEKSLLSEKSENGKLELMKKEPKHMDDLMRLGRYCFLCLVVIEVMTLTSLICMIYMVYAGAAPEVKGCGEHVFNTSAEACAVLSELRETTGCTPILEYQFLSVNIEFDYLCAGGKVVKDSISLQMFGVLVGAIVFGQISDGFGRKKALLISLSGISVTCMLNSYVPSFFYFTLMRIIVGFFTGGLTTVQGVFMIENVPKKHRMWISTTVTWSPNFIIFPFIAYISHDWRTLLQVNAAAAGLACVLLFFVYETPRFLVQKGRIDEARRVLSGIRRIDGDTSAKNDEDFEQMLLHEKEIIDSRQKKQRKYTYYHIVCTWTMMLWTGILCFGTATASLVNYGLMFNMEKLSGSLYWNNTFLGMIRWAMNISIGISDWMFPWFGRKLINLIAVTFNSSALAIVCYLYLSGNAASSGWILRACTIGVTAMCSQVYIAKFMACNELYPTAIRNLSVSTMQMSSRIGTILAPQLFYLSDVNPVIPYAVLLFLTLIDLVAFQACIPESKGKNLENHLPPKEQRIFGRSKSGKSLSSAAGEA